MDPNLYERLRRSNNLQDRIAAFQSNQDFLDVLPESDFQMEVMQAAAEALQANEAFSRVRLYLLCIVVWDYSLLTDHTENLQVQSYGAYYLRAGQILMHLPVPGELTVEPSIRRKFVQVILAKFYSADYVANIIRLAGLWQFEECVSGIQARYVPDAAQELREACQQAMIDLLGADGIHWGADQMKTAFAIVADLRYVSSDSLKSLLAQIQQQSTTRNEMLSGFFALYEKQHARRGRLWHEEVQSAFQNKLSSLSKKQVGFIWWLAGLPIVGPSLASVITWYFVDQEKTKKEER